MWARLNLNSDGGTYLTVNANTTTNFGSTQHLAAVNVGPAATATVTAGGQVLVANSLAIDATAKLDLTNNGLIVQSDTTTRRRTGESDRQARQRLQRRRVERRGDQ